MTIRLSKTFLLSVFFLITLYITLYFLALVNFPYICGISNPWVLIWCSSPPGHLFPLPSPSGPLAVLTSNDNLVDYIIYVYFFKTRLLIALLGFLWIFDTILFYRWIYSKK